MKGLEALEFFLENWHSKMKESDRFCEFDALVEYNFGAETKVYESPVVIEKFFQRKILFDNVDEINEFLPEDVEYDVISGNLYIKRNLFEIKIAPKIF